MTKCNFAHFVIQSIEATKHGILVFFRCSYYHVLWSVCSNVFLFVSSFPVEILKKPALPTGKCFAFHFVRLILRDQWLSTRFPKDKRILFAECCLLDSQSHGITLYQGWFVG